MAYYQIQNLDDLKQIYTDVQVVNVVSDDVGVSTHNRSQQLLLQDDQILLNDGGQQQVVYQTTSSANQQHQYQQPSASTTTHYIIGDDISAQPQQQPQHQQIMLQPHSTMDHHQQQQQAQTQQHYQQDPQQVQVQQMQDHQLQHVQPQQQQQQPQQLYYTTDQILQQHSTQQPQLHVQQQQQQQQYQQQQIAHQHAMQSPSQQQAQPQQQIVYRMQPQQSSQIHHPQTHAHVIVQQPSGQQVLIQSPQHQEIVMRQPMPQQRIIYNTNRVIYSPHQSQPQAQAILQQSPTAHQQQQQQHIQLQKPQEQSQQLQQSVVFHQIQTVQNPQLQIRGAIRTKVPRGGGITGTPTLFTRMPNSPVARAARPTLLTPVSAPAGAQTMKTPRPRSSAAAGGTPRGRGASRGGRGAGRGQQIAMTSPVGNNMQSVLGQPQQMLQQVGVATHQGKNITIAGMHPQGGQIRHVYRTQQVLDPIGVSQQQQVQLVQRSAVTSQGNLRFRSPPMGVTPSQAQIQSPATSNCSSSGNYEQDLEESIQAVVVKKDQQKTVSGPANSNAMDTTLTTYYAKDDDENHRYIRTQNGACISLTEYKKRSLVNAGSSSSTSSIGPVKGIIPMRSGGPPQTNPASTSSPKLQPHASATSNPSVPIARVMPQQKMCQQQPQLQQQQQQIDSLSQAAPSSSVHQTSHNNYEIQTQHVLQNRSGQQMAEKDRNSAKMLVILVSGEQRLITFTLPRESCTVQDLLEQVGVPFDSTTTIQCVENPGANIDFVVTVGFSVQESASELISRAEQSLQMSRQQESGIAAAAASATSTSNTSNSGNANTSVATPPPAAASVYNSLTNTTCPTTTPAAISVSVADESTKDSAVAVSGSTSAVKEEVPRKIIQGFYAICQSCGFNSYDHAKCERCKRVFLEPPKRVPCVKSIGTNVSATSGGDSSSLIVSKSSSVPEIADKKRANDLIARGSKVGLTYNAGTVTRGRGGSSSSRGRSTRSGRRAAEIEPVILTLSSDEEDEDDSSNKDSTNISAVNPSNVSAMYTSITFPTFSFEPMIPDKDETPIYADFNRGDITDLSNCPDKLITTLKCKVIRIGTYRFDPEEAVTFTSKGIRIVAPVVTNQSESCALHIHQREVVKIIAHFSKTSDSMLCFYTLRKCAQYIKESLNMKDNGVNADGIAYFSPNGPYQVRKIILQFDSISDQARSVIKSIWDFFDEISMTDAQDLLQRAAEADRQLAAKTNEESNTSSAATTTQLNPNEIRQLLIYPQGKGGISINTEDYLCLATDQYLNDIIIDFYLKWVHNNVIPEQQRQKTFIFSTFFYKRLTTLTRHQHQDKEIKQTAAQKRHSRVQNWTKNVNLFEKDFIIIPINEQSHWFLAIICFPKFEGPVTFDTNVPVELQQIKKQSKGKKVALQIGNTTITPLSKRVAGENSTPNVLAEVCAVGDDDSERDEAEGDESDLASEDSDFENSNGNSSAGATTTINTSVSGAAITTAASTTASSTTATTNTNIPTANNNNTTTTNNNSNSDRTQSIKQPLILIFDSLAGASRSRVVATLRDYLTCEYKAKMPEVPTPRVFNKDSMPGHCVKVPQQNNFTDCGLYLLQYVEHFFNDPIRDYRMPIKQLNNWFDTLTVTRKREDISILLQKLMNEKNGPNQKIILPDIPFPTQNGQLVEPPEGYNIEFEEEEMEEEAVEEEDEHAAIGTTGETTDMELGTDELNAKTSAAKATTSLVPTQGRKIVVKRRMQIVNSSSSSSNNDASSPTPANTRSMIKIRKIEQ